MHSAIKLSGLVQYTQIVSQSRLKFHQSPFAARDVVECPGQFNDVSSEHHGLLNSGLQFTHVTSVSCIDH